MLGHRQRQEPIRPCLSLGSQVLTGDGEKASRHQSAKGCDSTALLRLRPLQQAVREEQELEEKMEGRKRVGDDIGRETHGR